MKYISFNLPKCFIYLILIAIIRSLTDYIRNYGKKYFKNAIFRLFLMFIGQFTAIFFYLIQKLILNKQFKGNSYIFFSEDDQEKNNKRKYSIFILFFVTLLSFFGELNWRDIFYNYEMKKVKPLFIKNLNDLVLFSSYIFAEKYLLEMNTYRHHYLAIGLNILSFIIICIYYSFDTKWSYFRIPPFICLILISFESQFIQSISLTIPKKLNHDYFINMNYILIMQGIIGIIYCFIFDFIYSNIFKYDINFYTRISSLIDNKSEFVILVISYIIFICILNILMFKVIEETKPSYLVTASGLSNLFIQISHYNQNKFFKQKLQNELNIITIIFTFFLFLSFCIFSESISLHFWRLDKYTNEEISNRGKKDTLAFIHGFLLEKEYIEL
jgi:hypothetical protein